MAIIYKNLKINLASSGPLLLLYFLSITELDTQFSNYFELLSFNLQLIIVYYWSLRNPSLMGNGHIFFAGLINDVIMGLPLGTSSLTYLVTCFVATYIRNVTAAINARPYITATDNRNPSNSSKNIKGAKKKLIIAPLQYLHLILHLLHDLHNLLQFLNIL